MAKGIFVSIVIRKCYTTRRKTKEKGKEDAVIVGRSGGTNETTGKGNVGLCQFYNITSTFQQQHCGIERRNINILESHL
jgi:hypothetical protein